MSHPDCDALRREKEAVEKARVADVLEAQRVEAARKRGRRPVTDSRALERSEANRRRQQAKAHEAEEQVKAGANAQHTPEWKRNVRPFVPANTDSH